MTMHYRTLTEQVFQADGFFCTVPEGTVFEMPDEWEPNEKVARVETEWLREQRRLLFDLDALRQRHGDVEARAASKRWLLIELRLLRTGESGGYELDDLAKLHSNACRMNRLGMIGDAEFWDFLEIIEHAEDRLRQVIRHAARAGH